MLRHFCGHPLFERITKEEEESDPVVPLLFESSEEGQKLDMCEVEYEVLPTHNVGVRLSICGWGCNLNMVFSINMLYNLWLQVHLTAGAIAGAVEHCAMFPFDSVKTRLQSLCPCPETRCPTPVHSLWSIIKREGWLRPLRGVNAVAAGSLPAHALYYTTYEKMKHFLTGNTAGHSNTLSYGAAGIMATLVHDAVMNPAEVVKQRMQMQFSPYGSSWECVRCIYIREGMVAFYRSYTTQLIMTVPFQAIHFMTYEFWQEVLNPRHKYHPPSHLIAGAFAGGVAAALTTPLDCIKTVLNTQQTPLACRDDILLKTAVSYRNISDVIKVIYLQRGLSGFSCGMQARMIFQAPATALSWSVYELFKYILT
ncbi:putative mitoferrin-1 [Dictyocaulus viviparus]|uniref:Putative mitoferrin-1 n=1 Tax=Dictyocaulus viviparus TaxID=29172 RepID=A0A0D8XTX7_DICVI|nr:putative mitoferrin-1 [Dictyocaulus viviparus]